jgi:hypothetical protein
MSHQATFPQVDAWFKLIAELDALSPEIQKAQDTAQQLNQQAHQLETRIHDTVLLTTSLQELEAKVQEWETFQQKLPGVVEKDQLESQQRAFKGKLAELDHQEKELNRLLKQIDELAAVETRLQQQITDLSQILRIKGVLEQLAGTSPSQKHLLRLLAQREELRNQADAIRLEATSIEERQSSAVDRLSQFSGNYLDPSSQKLVRQGAADQLPTILPLPLYRLQISIEGVEWKAKDQEYIVTQLDRSVNRDEEEVVNLTLKYQEAERILKDPLVRKVWADELARFEINANEYVEKPDELAKELMSRKASLEEIKRIIDQEDKVRTSRQNIPSTDAVS